MTFDRVYDANENWIWGQLSEDLADIDDEGNLDLRLIRALCILGGYKIGTNWAAPDSYWLIAPNGAYHLIRGSGKDASGHEPY